MSVAGSRPLPGQPCGKHACLHAGACNALETSSPHCCGLVADSVPQGAQVPVPAWHLLVLLDRVCWRHSGMPSDAGTRQVEKEDGGGGICCMMTTLLHCNFGYYSLFLSGHENFQQNKCYLCIQFDSVTCTACRKYSAQTTSRLNKHVLCTA